MKFLRKWFHAVSVMLIMLLVAACGANKPASTGVTHAQPQKAPEVSKAPAEKAKLTLATATEGGVFWPMGQEMAKIWNESVPAAEVTAITTGGTGDNITKLGFKQVQLGFAVSGVAFYAANGTGDYKTQGKQTALRGVLALHPNVVHMVVRKDSGIKSLKDLNGKSWAPGARGSATEVNTREMAGVFGIDSGSDMKGFYLGYNETVENMKSGKIDGATLSAGIGGAAVKDALALGGWEILSLTQDEVDAIVKEYPAYFPITIPAGSYAGQTAPILTVAQSSILLAREDLSEDTVYQMTKSFYENLGRLQEKVSAAKAITKENGLKGITGVVPLHAGAEKYFREAGVLK